VNPLLITAFGSLLPDGGLPDEIVYLPEGNHAITPFVDGASPKGMSPCMNRTLAPYAHQP
jgi:hypothetical protein